MGLVRCPRCGDPVEACGEATIDGVALGVYQCGRCTQKWQFDGAEFEVALTFALDQDGRCIDPETALPVQ